MSAIKEKIAKLLALSGSPNEKEAQEALLKARELMAKHKLQPEECQGQSGANVVRKTVGVECTKMTDTWALPLANVIARQYCCRVYRNHVHGAKKVTVGFAGLEDDFEVCRRIYLYAYDCVKSRCREIRHGHRDICSAKELREMCNAYGWGFCQGLSAAFQEQEKKPQEWGLVMVVPTAVNQEMDKLGKPTQYATAKLDGWRTKYANAGYHEGKKFVPDRGLEATGAKNKASA